MTHEKLKKAPVTYVLAQVRFTSIESIGEYVAKIQDKLRKDFPLFKKVSIHSVEVHKDDQSASIFYQWHFLDKNSQLGIILDKSSISIHVSDHQDFDFLAEKFQKVLASVDDVLEIGLYTRLGVRYVNVIDQDIDKYIRKEFLGAHLKGKNFDENKYISDNELTQKTQNGLLRLKTTLVGSQAVLQKDAYTNLLVSPELRNSAEFLKFPKERQPKDKFFMLDIDHASSGLECEFDTGIAISKLRELQEYIYRAFHEIVTEQAIKNWNK